tara:strand:+ start:575 stop:862 length:288 start_codon:yes stop_codon:yes gene_type:complete
MDFNEIISSMGFGIGLLQMYDQVNKERGKIEDKKMPYLALFASLLWVVYQYRKFGWNIATVYTSVGFIVQLYVLKTVLEKDESRYSSVGVRSHVP